MNIVLTGISATPYAREYLSNMALTLRERGHNVFVPHEGKGEPEEPRHAKNRFDFEATYSALKEADLLMAILDGYSVDDAVATQLGIFYALAREGDRERKIVGLLHDTRIAGWDWTVGDRALSAQIREAIHQYGSIYPNFKAALAALEEEGV